MAAPPGPRHDADLAGWDAAARAMYRAAQAVAHPAGRRSLPISCASWPACCRRQRVRRRVRRRRAHAHCARSRPGSTAVRCATSTIRSRGRRARRWSGAGFRYVARGVSAEFPPGTIFGAKGMDSYAAYPLNDSAGAPLGLLVAMDRAPIADATLAEALLKIFAGRIAAEIERGAPMRRATRPKASAARARGAAPLRGQLPRDLRGGRGRDLHPRLGHRRGARRQPEGLRDLRLQRARSCAASRWPT